MIASTPRGREPVVGRIHARLLTSTVFSAAEHAAPVASDHQRLPGVPRSPGGAAGSEPPATTTAKQACINCTVHEQSIFAQRTTLSRPAEGYQIFLKSTNCRWPRPAPSNSARAAPQSGAHHSACTLKKTPATCSTRGFRSGAEDLPRLQSQRHAAHRDRHRARPSFGDAA